MPQIKPIKHFYLRIY